MNATYVVTFISLNLVTSNFLITLLPKNVIQFAVGMWSPALFSVVFCLLQGLPINTTLGLQSGRRITYLFAFIYPIVVGIGTVLLGVSFSLLIKTDNASINVLSVAINLLIWILAALGEELGWRGYLHKSLDNRTYSPLLIGVVWSAWHFNQLITQQGIAYSLFIFTPLLVLLSYVLSTVRAVGRSIWPCAIFHGTWNLLRTKILFADSINGSTGFFYTESYSIANTEGLFGLISLLLLTAPLFFFYKKRIVSWKR